jgi:hypothetical protein
MARILVGIPALLGLLAACSGGGGGAPAGLQPGVTLNASWTLAVVVTTVDGPCGGAAVGQAQTTTVTTSQVGDQIALDLGSGQTLSTTLAGLVANFSRTVTGSEKTLTTEVTVTFTADGRSFTAVGKQTQVSGAGTCVVETQGNAERLATAVLATDAPFVAEGAVLTSGLGLGAAAHDVVAPTVTVSDDGHWLAIDASAPFDAVHLATTSPDDCWRLDLAGAQRQLTVESPAAMPVWAVQVHTALGWSQPVRLSSEVGR